MSCGPCGRYFSWMSSSRSRLKHKYPTHSLLTILFCHWLQWLHLLHKVDFDNFFRLSQGLTFKLNSKRYLYMPSGISPGIKFDGPKADQTEFLEAISGSGSGGCPGAMPWWGVLRGEAPWLKRIWVFKDPLGGLSWNKICFSFSVLWAAFLNNILSIFHNNKRLILTLFFRHLHK